MKNTLLRSVVLGSAVILSAVTAQAVPTSIHCDEYYTNMQKGNPAAVSLKYLDIEIQADGSYVAVQTDKYTPTASDIQSYSWLKASTSYTGQVLRLASGSDESHLVLTQGWTGRDKAGGEMGVTRTLTVDLSAKTASDVTKDNASLMDQLVEVVGMSPTGGDYTQPGSFVNCVAPATQIPQPVVDVTVKAEPLATPEVDSTGAIAK